MDDVNYAHDVMNPLSDDGIYDVPGDVHSQYDDDCSV